MSRGVGVWSRYRAAVGGGAIATVFSLGGSPGVVYADDEKSFSSENIMDLALPAAESVGLGTVGGFAAGYFAKKAGKLAAVAVGGLFCIFQLAASQGYVEIKWDKLEKDFTKAADMNSDGIVNEKDVQVGLKSVTDLLSHNMAATGTGFAGGFLLGLKKG